MSGSYVDASAESRAADTAMIAAAVNAAYTATQNGQAGARRFYIENGAAVNDGHADTVGAAGAPPAVTFDGPVQ